MYNMLWELCSTQQSCKCKWNKHLGLHFHRTVFHEGKVWKWHLFQTHQTMFRKLRSADSEECLATASSTAGENSQGSWCRGCVISSRRPWKDEVHGPVFILKFKTIPAVLPEHALHPVDKEHKKLISFLNRCCANVPLSDPAPIYSIYNTSTHLHALADT